MQTEIHNNKLFQFKKNFYAPIVYEVTETLYIDIGFIKV
jgi:hypothetical protein